MLTICLSLGEVFLIASFAKNGALRAFNLKDVASTELIFLNMEHLSMTVGTMQLCRVIIVDVHAM
jgi:hypothetical protein